MVVVLAVLGSGLSASGADVPRWKAWICSPAISPDWCNTQLSITSIDAAGHGRVEEVSAARAPRIDCFYVYPTVSHQLRANSTLEVTDHEKAIALVQAAQFQRVCRVFAPMYRQVTAYQGARPGNHAFEYDDILAAWRDYLAHHNRGRGVVLIGHSAGTYILAKLIREQIEKSPAQRKLLVSAILLGGNITVADGSETGGDFRLVRPCRKPTQVGCVVAYSSWGRTPPKDARFIDAERGEHVLCVNPAALAGGKAPITPVFAWPFPNGIISRVPNPQPETTFLAFPGLYTARCVKQGRRAWLLVERVPSLDGDRRPTVEEISGPGWGLHAADVTIALGNLVTLVRSQGQAWAAHR
jgi:pimeloyl-ACP methyl ester carboxylesterase